MDETARLRRFAGYGGRALNENDPNDPNEPIRTIWVSIHRHRPFAHRSPGTR